MKTLTLITATAAAALMLSGCIALAPVTVAWRSNSSQQTASTDGKNTAPLSGNAVNADKTTETAAAVTTGTGSANTAMPDSDTTADK